MQTNPSDSPHHHAATPFPVLHPWDTGPAVARMQELLRAHGVQLRVDGDFGWRTEMAVKVFQRQHGLRIDGIVGTETWATLMATVKPGTRLLRQGCSGADVYELQGLMQVNGYAIKRDGKFGAETKSAVIAFQREHHLRDDGIVDSVLWALLRGKRTADRKPTNARLSIKKKR
jgi:peptidoglycan hydrolase-like protein with peptidoglycan-binding domain